MNVGRAQWGQEEEESGRKGGRRLGQSRGQPCAMELRLEEPVRFSRPQQRR